MSMRLGIAESYRDVLGKCGHLTDHVIRLINLSRTRAEPGHAGARRAIVAVVGIRTPRPLGQVELDRPSLPYFGSQSPDA